MSVNDKCRMLLEPGREDKQLEKILLIGAGGHAKTVLDTILRQNLYNVVGFIEREGSHTRCYRDYSTVGTDKDLESWYQKGVRNAVITIGYLGTSDARENLFDRLKSIGFCLPFIVDDTAVIAEDVTIGEGTYVGRNAVVNASAKLGAMCIINTAAIVEHDCVIGDFAHVSVGSVLCGGVKVGRSALIGANATILQMISIGEQAVVGAGAAVIRDIEANTVAIGIPARVIRGKNNE